MPTTTRREFRNRRFRRRVWLLIESRLVNYYRLLMSEARPLRAELETALARLHAGVRDSS